jgi:pantoate--beta-alanine ligase
VDSVRAELRAADVREDYVELVAPATLRPLERADRPDARLLVAAFVGTTRLIDNAPVG